MEKNERNKKGRIKTIIFVLAIILFIIALFIFVIILNQKNREIQEKAIETISVSNSEEINENENVTIIEKTPEISSKTTDWDLILVNKENRIPDNYNYELDYIESGNRVDSRIKSAVTQMLADARKEGLQPYICSSYRTHNTQQKLFNKKVNKYKKLGYTQEDAEYEASYWVAIPGTSEHEIGLALDIVSKNFQVLDKRQEDTDVQKWLMEHCIEYGFILRYPTEKKEITKINYEPWHYRYVGIENAKFMKEKNFCLEEYIQYLKE